MKQIISAQLWLVNNNIYLRAYSITTAGIGLADNPIYIISQDKFDILGGEILKAFKDCKMGVPHPNYKEKQPKDEMLTVTKFKSQKAIMRTGKAVDVYLKDEQMKIVPMFFNGKYLTSSPDRYMYCSLDPDDITKTVLAAFEQCHP